MTMAPASSSFCSDGALPSGARCCSAGVPPDGRHIGGVDVVLDDDGKARRAAGPVFHDIDLGRRRQRAILVEDDEGIEILDLLGALEGGFGDVGGRHLLVADRGDDLGGRRGEWESGHGGTHSCERREALQLAAAAIDDARISRREGLVGHGILPVGVPDVYSFGRLSNTRLALPSERSSVSGATARMRAVMPMVFLM